MNSIINNLLSSNGIRSDKSLIATVVSRIDSHTYIVRDFRGRKTQVASEKTYTPGNTIIVKNGFIVGKQKSLQNIKSYEV